MEHKVERKPVNLVIACGRNCPRHDHPEERWVSVDPGMKLNPDIQKKLQALKRDDFKKFNRDKFDTIYIEGIGKNLDANDFKILSQFLEENGSIIIYPMDVDALQLCANVGIRLEQFIMTEYKVILFKNAENVAQTLRLIEEDLKHTFLNSDKIKAIANETTRILEKEQKMHPLLASSLAHINVYINLRKQRKFRNYFQDENYEKFARVAREKFIQYDKGIIKPESLIEFLQDQKLKFPSISTPRHKITYDPLAYILEICENAVNLHVIQMKRDVTLSRSASIEKKP